MNYKIIKKVKFYEGVCRGVRGFMFRLWWYLKRENISLPSKFFSLSWKNFFFFRVLFLFKFFFLVGRIRDIFGAAPPPVWRVRCALWLFMKGLIWIKVIVKRDRSFFLWWFICWFFLGLTWSKRFRVRNSFSWRNSCFSGRNLRFLPICVGWPWQLLRIAKWSGFGYQFHPPWKSGNDRSCLSGSRRSKEMSSYFFLKTYTFTALFLLLGSTRQVIFSRTGTTIPSLIVPGKC